MPLGLGLPTTQAELGQAALKVGGTVLSGMRTLGGLALSAAKSRVASGGMAKRGAGAGAGEPASGGVAVTRFFSRSAPSEGVVGEREEEPRRERRYSSGSGVLASSPGPGGSGAAQALGGVHAPEGGCWVSVVDLDALLSRRESGVGVREPEKVAEFLVSKDKPVAGLRFSSDGCAVVVVPRDGQVAQLFQLRLGPAVGSRVAGEASAVSKKSKRPSAGMVSNRETRTPWHVYDLRRGRTSAVVEAVECADDGRWVAIATRKRTVHVFPVNPYGGKPDHRSHLEGRVRNVDELVSG